VKAGVRKCTSAVPVGRPVQFIVEDVHQTPIELPCSSNDSGGGVQDVLQLVSRSSWRVRKQGVAITPEVMLDENP